MFVSDVLEVFCTPQLINIGFFCENCPICFWACFILARRFWAYTDVRYIYSTITCLNPFHIRLPVRSCQ